MNEERKQKKDDAILGSNIFYPVDDFVLSGIDGIKYRFNKANFSNANLYSVYFSSNKFPNTNFDGANVKETKLDPDYRDDDYYG